MQYLCMLYSDNSQWGEMFPEQQQQGIAACGAYTQALKEAASPISCKSRHRCSICGHGWGGLRLDNNRGGIPHRFLSPLSKSLPHDHILELDSIHEDEHGTRCWNRAARNRTRPGPSSVAVR